MKLNLNKPICFFDLETTGPRVGKDRIVEIAILKVEVDKTEKQKIWRINPEMEISFQATQVHGITNKMVENEQNFATESEGFYSEKYGGGSCTFFMEKKMKQTLHEEIEKK